MKNKAALFVTALALLNGCSLGSGMFDKKKAPPVKGERISVLELQKSLVADTPLASGETFEIPPPWNNIAWPQAGGYPNHTMHNLALSEQIELRWKADIGVGSSEELPLTAQPIVAAGSVFTLDSHSKLSAFNASTGKKLWSKKLQKKKEDDPVISGGIAFAHKRLYVTTGYDEIIALNPENGDIFWKKRLPAPARAAPSVLNGRVFVSTLDSKLTAFSAKDGTNLWTYSGINESAGLVTAASPAVNNDIVIPAFSSGEITALRVENGSVAWSDNLTSLRKRGAGMENLTDISAMPIANQGTVVAISFGGKIAAIDERSGNRLWQKEISGSQTPWLSGRTLFVISSDNQLIALNLNNGAIHWVEQLPAFADKKRKKPIRWTGPVMGSGNLILVGSHGMMIKIDPNTGQQISTIKTKKDVQIAPLIAQNMLFILAEDGTLMAYQ